MTAVIDRFTQIAAVGVVLVFGAVSYARICAYASFAAAVQRRTFRRIVRENAETPLGKVLGLGECRSPDDLAVRKPVSGYEFFRPYVDESLRTGDNLLSAQPIIGFTSTSGTSSEPKRIPISRRQMARERRREVLLALFAVFRQRPSLIYRPVLLMIAGEERQDHGRSTHQAVANTMYRKSFFGRFSAIPASVYEIADNEAKYYYYALLAMAAEARLVITPNPSSIIRMLEVAAKHDAAIGEDLRSGAAADRFGIPPKTLLDINERLAVGRPFTGREQFPGLRAVLCWRSGPSQFFWHRLKAMLPERIEYFDLGYVASDTPLTYRLAAGGRQICAFDDVYFEFLPEDPDEPEPAIAYADMVLGRSYRIVVTNAYGLYRYDIGDIVRATGYFGRAPTIEFVRKVDGFSNMTGEKLSEDQVIDAVQGALDLAGLRCAYFAVAPHFPSSSYRLYLDAGRAESVPADTLAGQVDVALSAANQEYDAKRRSERLGALQVVVVRPGAFDRCKASLVARGRREAQFKLPHLIVDEKLLALVVGEGG